MNDWLTDFVRHTSYGETPAKILWWVGVVTIAGALRRKVWIDQFTFQWTPNFYLLIVGPPDIIKKSTSVSLGTRLLRRIKGIDFGPQIVTWQQLVTHMADARETVKIGEVDFQMSCVTIALSEFGTLFDPNDRNMVDVMTDIWDGKLEPITKETKTNGHDEIINPWLNIYACTTPGWIADNFSSRLIRSGFASRPVYLYCDEPLRDVAYPRRQMPEPGIMLEEENDLVSRLQTISEYAGEYTLTEAAYEWGTQWYADYRRESRSSGFLQEAGFGRRQTHLHKLAMVISAARGKFPVIDVDELREADARLRELEMDVQRVFGYVGQSPGSKTANELVQVLAKTGSMNKKVLYRKFFFRTTSSVEFEEAVKSAKASGLVQELGEITDPVIGLV